MRTPPNSTPPYCTPSCTTTMDPVEAAIAEINSLPPEEPFTFQAIAKKYGVVRSTLQRRHRAETQPRTTKAINQRVLSPMQEEELVKWIQKMNERHIPPRYNLVRNWASTIAQKEVGKNWVFGFLKRHRDRLVAKQTNAMDRNRHQADSKVKYEAYFTYWHGKMEEYQLEPGNIYNMDEKGLMLGVTGRSKRVFSRDMWEQGELRSNLQDGSREWITILATICADGTALPPSLVFQSDAEQVSTSWVEDITPDQPAWTSATLSGWSNNELGLAWLQQVFDRETKAKAKRSWRLLITDGHDSHTSMDFINYCDRNRILLAVFPSHATHTLQPLDVVMFKSLSTNYQKELDDFILQSKGLLSMAKRDFFALFWKAWVATMEKPLILKAFQATGLWPQNAEPILQRFTRKQPSVTPESSDDSKSSLSGWIKIDRRLKAVTNDDESQRTKRLREVIHHLVVENELLHHENEGLERSLEIKQKRKKRGRPVVFEQEDYEHGGALWLSPKRVQRHRDFLEQEAIEKQQQKEQKAAEKAAKKASKQLQANVAAERRVQVAAERAKKKQEKAAAKALQIHKKNKAALAKKRQQIKQKDKPKPVSNPQVKSKQMDGAGGGAGGGESPGGATSAPPAEPPKSRSGRNLNPPKRYRSR